MTLAGNFTTSDGISLAYYADDFTDPWKPASSVLMLHAAMGSAWRYFAWVPHLARDHRVVRLDLRGHGGSQVPPDRQQLALDRLVADVAELLDHLGCEKAHIVGNSAGGYLGQQLAMTHPERASRCSARRRGSRTARRRAGSHRSKRRGCAAFSPRRSATGSRPMPIPGSSAGFSTRRATTTRPISPNSCC
jgi:pimeloyl-ACP methyl ester carboxylesterase